MKTFILQLDLSDKNICEETTFLQKIIKFVLESCNAKRKVPYIADNDMWKCNFIILWQQYRRLAFYMEQLQTPLNTKGKSNRC